MTTVPPRTTTHIYISGLCETAFHRRCHGRYAGTACHCSCHQTRDDGQVAADGPTKNH